MTPTEVQALIQSFKDALELAQTASTYQEGRRRCAEIQATLDSQTELAPVIQLLWNECLNACRSAAFWHELSDVEKTLSNNLSEKNMQLQRNYLRLAQEQ